MVEKDKVILNRGSATLYTHVHALFINHVIPLALVEMGNMSQYMNQNSSPQGHTLSAVFSIITISSNSILSVLAEK